MLPSIKDNVYQVCFTDPAQGTASAQYIAEHKLAEKVAVIYNNADAYSTGVYQTFDAGGQEAGSGGLSPFPPSPTTPPISPCR